jgi:hypothetical protein
MISDFFGFKDYAYEMIDYLEKQPHLQNREIFLGIFDGYKRSLTPRTRVHSILNLIKYLRLQKNFERILRIGEKFSDAYRANTRQGRKTWAD